MYINTGIPGFLLACAGLEMIEAGKNYRPSTTHGQFFPIKSTRDRFGVGEHMRHHFKQAL